MKKSVIEDAISRQNKVSNDQTLRPLAQRIVRNAIIDGKFPAGQKLIERELCELTGASRSVLREALASLEASGLVERQSYCGFRVAKVSARKVVEIFELRASLETLAAELFAVRASEEEMAALVQAFHEIEKRDKKFILSDMRSAKERYFGVIFAGCRNEEIVHALGNVIDRIDYLRSRLLLNQQRRKASLEEFRFLTEALISRNPIEIRKASLRHLYAARDAVLDVLAEENTVVHHRPRKNRAA